ncbi:putative LysR family transcriptional regulator [Streptomyces sp. W007]|nr:putative LysR family transcriptional regulator [Streptomyces sp. W007]
MGQHLHQPRPPTARNGQAGSRVRHRTAAPRSRYGTSGGGGGRGGREEERAPGHPCSTGQDRSIHHAAHPVRSRFPRSGRTVALSCVLFPAPRAGHRRPGRARGGVDGDQAGRVARSGSGFAHQEHVDRVLPLQGEPVPLIEPPGGASPQHVQAYGDPLGVRAVQQGAQDGGADAVSLEGGGEEEALQPPATSRPRPGGA